MFSNNQPAGEMSNEEIKARLKPILVDIRLLQRSCQMANFPWMMPEKYRGQPLEALQDKQRVLIAQKRNLPTIKLSDEELNEVVQAAEQEAARLIEGPSVGEAAGIIGEHFANHRQATLMAEVARREAEFTSLGLGGRNRK